MSSTFKEVVADTPDNQELDEAFTKLNLYLIASENKTVKKLLYSNLEVLSKEITKRDSSLKNRLTQYLITIKGMIS